VTGDQYVASVIAKYAVGSGSGSPAQKAAADLAPLVGHWGDRWLLEMTLSGSYAKGTAISLGTDVDLFISISHAIGTPVNEIYWNLFGHCETGGLNPEAQNVSMRVVRNGIKVDLVPGRKQLGGTDHTLYKRKEDTWVQTNVGKHIELVRESGRTSEIRVVKIWRQLHRLDFPSFYLELTTIEALKQGRAGSLAANVATVFRYLAESFVNARVVDPANTNNVISDDLDLDEKRAVMNAARVSLQRNWEQVIW
jgi:hypothetical protein